MPILQFYIYIFIAYCYNCYIVTDKLKALEPNGFSCNNFCNKV